MRLNPSIHKKNFIYEKLTPTDPFELLILGWLKYFDAYLSAFGHYILDFNPHKVEEPHINVHVIN